MLFTAMKRWVQVLAVAVADVAAMTVRVAQVTATLAEPTVVANLNPFVANDACSALRLRNV